MKTIYKYPLNFLDYKIVKGSIEKFLSVGYQSTTESICAWAIVDDLLPEKEYIISCYGTGHQIPRDPGQYMGTVQMYAGEVILHYFVKELLEYREMEKEKIYQEAEMVL